MATFLKRMQENLFGDSSVHKVSSFNDFSLHAGSDGALQVSAQHVNIRGFFARLWRASSLLSGRCCGTEPAFTRAVVVKVHIGAVMECACALRAAGWFGSNGDRHLCNAAESDLDSTSQEGEQGKTSKENLRPRRTNVWQVRLHQQPFPHGSSLRCTCSLADARLRPICCRIGPLNSHHNVCVCFQRRSPA